MSQYAKPLVTIGLDEYLDLQNKAKETSKTDYERLIELYKLLNYMLVSHTVQSENIFRKIQNFEKQHSCTVAQEGYIFTITLNT